MEGIVILSEQVSRDGEGLAFGLIMGLITLICLLCFIDAITEKKLGAAIVLFIVTLTLSAPTTLSFMAWRSPNSIIVEHKVTIDDSVRFNDVLKYYEVQHTDGNIWVLRKR